MTHGLWFADLEEYSSVCSDCALPLFLLERDLGSKMQTIRASVVVHTWEAEAGISEF